MIKFNNSVFLALNTDNDGAIFSPIKGRGDAHVLVIPSAELPGVDALAFATDGRIGTVCGKKLKASNLTAGMSRELCTECAGFLASMSHGIERDRVLLLANQVTAMHKGREIDAVARITDGKCAFVLFEDGEEVLHTVHGRSKISPVEGTVTVAAGIGKGETGVCPFCRESVKLTGSGYLSTHRPGGVRPDRPQLSQKAVPAVDRGTPVAQEAKKREAESRDENGDAVVPVADKAGAAVGNRDHGRIDGAALVPGGDMPPVQPKSGYVGKAGVLTTTPVHSRTRPDKAVVSEVMHGDACPCSKDGKRRRGAYLTCEQYNALSRRQQRRYWENVKTAKERSQRARDILRTKREAQGQPTREERKSLRKAAAVGSSAEGTVHGHVHH